MPAPTSFSQSTGYLNVEEKGRLFYWLVTAKNSPQDAPLVLWLNGGPGSSSLIGMFYENGPYRINPTDLSIYEPKISWNSFAHVLYIEQPLGTGFSTPTDPSYLPIDEREVAKDILAALKDFFFNKHEEMKDKDFYIVGESFAGTYIPWIADKILNYNLNQKNTPVIRLKGIGIGDGTVDHLETMNTVAQYAFDNALISEVDKAHIERDLLPACATELAAINDFSVITFADSCQEIFNVVTDTAHNINIYDIRKWGQYDFRPLGCYLNQPVIKDTLGVSDITWANNSLQVFNRLRSNMNQSTVQKIRELLAKKSSLNVLIYNGQKDLLVNHIGTKSWVNKLAQGAYGDFTGRETFLKAKTVEWEVNGRIAGTLRKGTNLLYSVVFEAGHLVPMDQPEAALFLVRELLGIPKTVKEVIDIPAKPKPTN